MNINRIQNPALTSTGNGKHQAKTGSAARNTPPVAEAARDPAVIVTGRPGEEKEEQEALPQL